MISLRSAGAITAFVAVLSLSTVLAAEESVTVAEPVVQTSGTITPQTMSDLFVDICSEVGPMVVTINSRTTVTAMTPGFQGFPSPFFWDPWGGGMNDFFLAPREQQYVTEGIGSGVLVSPDGLILTNHHVVGEADEFTIDLQDGSSYPGTLVGTDPRTDLALIRIDADGLPAIPIGDSDDLQVGQWVLAVGSPFALSQTVTQGIVSYIGRSGMGLTDYEDYIQTDAAINPGNSGGALVNLDGELVGINTALATSNGGYQGIGFAIPVSRAVDVMADLMEYGYVRRGWMGVSVQDVTQGLARHFGLDEGVDGVLVSQVLDDTPAYSSGLQQGDILLSVDGQTFIDVLSFRDLIASIEPGTRVEVEYYRNGRTRDLYIVLGELESAQIGVAEPGADEDLGWTLGELDRSARNMMQIPGNVHGSLILEVRSGRAAEAGVRSGDIILQVDGEDVASASDTESLVAASDEVVLLIWRGGHTLYLVM